ncbi:MAG: MOSC domain-containing protein [Nocardioidaceae bacterium]
MTPAPRVAALAAGPEHAFSKPPRSAIRLLEGYGVEGDAHAGATIQHLSRMRKDPTQPNVRQVHVIAQELFDELTEAGYDVGPGLLGENVTTVGVDLLALPTGTLLHLGQEALIELTGLRNPCVQIDSLGAGLLKRVLHVDEDGTVVRRAGVMAVVRRGGDVSVGDAVRVVLPMEPHLPLDRV